MDKKVRNVLAIYIEEPDQGLAQYKVTDPWMTYIKEKEEPSVQDKSLIRILKHMHKKYPEAPDQGDGSEGSIYNLIDFKDPSGESKDQKGGPSSVYKYPSAPDDSGHFDKPQVFKDEISPLKQWADCRRIDFSDRPEEQYPAISLDNKLASIIPSIISRYLLQLNPVTIEGGVYKTAASLKEIRRNNTTPLAAKTDANARACTVLMKKDKTMLKRGYVQFTVTSPGSESKTVVFQFLKKPKSTSPTTATKKPTNYLDYDVELACNCESFVWYGSRYYAVKDKYMYMPMFNSSPPDPRKKLAPPNPTNVIVNTGRGKGLNFRMCKHVLAAMYYLIGKENLDEFLRADEVGEEGPVAWKTTAYYKNYPHIGPPSKLFNTEEWKKAFGFEFTLENLKREIKKIRPRIPSLFKKGPYPSYLRRVDNWLDKVWFNLDYLQKISVFEHYVVEHPEQIYYILLRDAIHNKGNVPDILIDKAYEIISNFLKNDGGIPQEAPEGTVEPTAKPMDTGEPAMLPETPEEIKEKEEKDKLKPITPVKPTAPTVPVKTEEDNFSKSEEI